MLENPPSLDRLGRGSDIEQLVFKTRECLQTEFSRERESLPTNTLMLTDSTKIFCTDLGFCS